MKLPNEAQWAQVEKFAEELGDLSPNQVALRLAELRAAGESATVLTMLSGWLELPPTPAPLGIGSVVGSRYTIREKLGEGAMGSVWRAKQESVGRDVALKMIHPALVTPALHARFEGEIKVLGQLDHPGIVRIFDAGVQVTQTGQAVPFFVMELVEGVPLDRWAATHRAERGAQLRLVAEICAAVQSAHERQIVHRDLKPSNILVRPDGRPVVLDFGIARLAGIAVGNDSGQFSGTPQYAAPEQHLGRDHDFRSGESVDVYAAGAILFEVLSGRRLFLFPSGASFNELRRIVLDNQPARLSDVLKDCPPLLDEIVASAVRRNPADRFYSIAALGRALTRAVALCSPAEPAPVPWSPAAGEFIPGTAWRLVEKIGEGGTGQVWAGIHDQLAERRVFKFCDTEDKARTLKREMTLFRLLKERVGRNPHFIQLHDVSLDEPPWYLMMDHTEAQDLVAWTSRQPGGLGGLPEALRLEIVAQVAEALQTAHEAGILHRDIKPANLLVRPSDSGRVHVLIADFGIGQIIADELLRGGTRLGFTRTVSDLHQSPLSGTMLYLAPEILEGNSATARSDIYSLGVVLWQLLIGNLSAALDPAGWSARIPDPLLRDDLSRCLTGSPEKRWASAGELAASLRALPDRRETAAHRQAELAARERAAYRLGVLRATVVAAVVLLGVLALARFAWVKSVEAEKQRKSAVFARTENALGEFRALAKNQSSEARKRLSNEMPKLVMDGATNKADFREVAIAILALREFEEIQPAPVQLSAMDRFSANGEKLILASAGDGIPRVVDLSAEPKRVQKLSGMQGTAAAVVVNLFGRAAGAVQADESLRLWFGSDLSKSLQLDGPVYANCFAISPTTLATSKRTAVAVARTNSAIDVFLPEVENSSPVRLLRRSSETENYFPESFPTTMLAFSLAQEGVLAAAGPSSGNLLFWKVNDTSAGALEGKFAGATWHPDVITCLGWSPVKDEIATGSRDGILRLWRFGFGGTSPMTDPSSRADLGEPIRNIAWNSAGSLLAVLLQSGKIRVLRGSGWEQTVSILNHPTALQISFAPNDLLVSWGAKGTRCWGTPDEPCFMERSVSGSNPRVSFQEQGSLIVATSARVDFFNPATLTWTAGFKNDCQYSAFGQGATFIYDDKGRWKSTVVTKEEGSSPALKFPMVHRPIEGVKICVASPQGSRTARINEDKTNQLWCLSGDQVEGAPATISGNFHQLAVSDAGAFTAWTDDLNVLHSHDHLTGMERTWISSNTVLGLAFAPDMLAYRTTEGIMFLNPLSGQREFCLLPAPGSLDSPIAFSPDGRWMAASGANHAVLIAEVPPESVRWKNGTLAMVLSNAAPLRAPTPRRINSLHWNASGSRLAGGTADGNIFSWNMSLLSKKLRLIGVEWWSDPPPREANYVPIRLN